MRKNLLAAVALAPLCLVASRGVALATDTVTGGNSSPIATATATSGAADDIDITSGSVSISSAAANAAGITPAVTINSSNSVTNENSISVSGVNNSAGVMVYSPTTLSGTISNTGTISNGDSYSASTNSNGLTEAPFANPSSTTRYGILLYGPGGLTGDITNTGTISVSGDSSAAISIQAPLTSGALSAGTAVTGGLYNAGTISYTGDNGAAIQSTKAGTISGPVDISGEVTATGTNSRAIDLEGAVGGRLSIYSTVYATGYAETTRPTTTSTLQNVQSVSSQVEQSAGAILVNGSVGGGILIGSPPVGTTTSTGSSVDLDGDGVADIDEGVGTVINYGSAPALQIGATASTTGITIGAVGGTDTTAAASSFGSTNNYGLIVEGSIAGEGVYDGVTATGLQIGASGVTVPVTVDGGIRVVGSISADSYLADATAIHIYAGATVPEIRNEDFVESSVSTSSATGTNVAGTSDSAAVSTAIQIEAGANVSTLTNFGTLQATANGDTMKAVAVKDLSGSVTSVLNEGVISAVVTPTTSGLDLSTGVNTSASGYNTALDLSANTTGVTLIQQVDPNPVAVEVSTTTSASGVVTTTAALTTVTASSTTTVVTTTAGVTTTTTTTTPTYPEIIGDVLLGNGANTVSILGGSVTGALSLGDGTGGSLTVGDASNSAVITGPVTFGGTGLALSVVNGSLFNTSPATMNLSSLNVSSQGVLYAAVNPASANTNAVYNVSGTATLASGAQIGIVLNTPLYTEETFKLISATTLNDSTGGALAQAAIPYIVTGTEVSSGGTISIDLRPKTAAEMGLNPAETAALGAIYKSLVNDSSIESAVLNQYTKSSFLNVYNQLLPQDYAGGLFELTLAASDAVTRATSRVNDIANPSGTRGAWAEEVAFGVNRSASSASAGYQGGGFGFVGGLEAGGAGLGAFGLTGSFLTGDIKDPHSPGENLDSFSEGEFGAYWQGQLGGFRADARAAGGYVLYSDRRELLLKDSSGDTTLDRNAKGSSSGYTATGHIGLGYQTQPFGWFYFRPQVHGDYFRLQESAFSEHGGAASNGGDGFDLSYASKTGDETSGTVSLVTGMTFGTSFQWRPELELGYRNVFTGTAGSTTATFTNGSPFTIDPDSIKGGGPMARLDVKADTDFYELNFEAGVEQRTHFETGDLRISVRVLF